ncbi:MAG: hypothetical protein JWO36_445 [Myxococcales bacterium]|nr:hypothetical protein [Myxococcales bacterium]
MRSLVVVILLVSGAGCRAKSSEGAPCGTVAGRFFTIAREELSRATVDPATRRAVTDQLPAMRDSLAQACVDGAWPPAIRDCLVNAATHVAFEACERQLTEAQRRVLETSVDHPQRETSP